jgi:hypothetical protein
MLAMLLLVATLAQAPAAPLTLEIRVFLGGHEVTGETRVTVHRAGERSAAAAQAQGREGTHVFTVPAGIYDAQIVREREGRVLNIRWAERLIVMPYPDEGGRHLEVVNFTNGYGALQVRNVRPDKPAEVGLFTAGERTRPAASRVAPRTQDDYVLYVVPAGRYDLQVRTAERPTWHADIEVPLDRTRLWVIPATLPDSGATGKAQSIGRAHRAGPDVHAARQ